MLPAFAVCSGSRYAGPDPAGRRTGKDKTDAGNRNRATDTERGADDLPRPWAALRLLRRRHKYIHNFDAELPLVMMPVDVLEGPGGAAMTDEYYGRLRPIEELCDLVHDPLAQRNLVTDPGCATVLTDLRGRVDRWMRETEDRMLDGVCPSCPDHTAAMVQWFRKDRFKPFTHLTTPGQVRCWGGTAPGTV